MIILLNLVATIFSSYMVYYSYKRKLQTWIIFINAASAVCNAGFVVVYILKHL